MTKNEHNNIDILKDLDIYSINIENKKDNDLLENESYNFTNQRQVKLDDNNNYNNEITETQEIEIKEGNFKTNNYFKGIFVFIKYIFTSSLIFAILLFTANYSAYINIAKSYIFKSEMIATQQKLISSVNANDIKDKYSAEIKENIKEELDDNNKVSIKKMKQDKDKENINLNIEITPYENRVVIPKIGQNIPLLDIKNRTISGENELNDIFMEELERGIIRYPGSAKPGETGNSFIFGHSSNFPWIKGDYNEVFSLIDNLSYGDEIIVYYGQEKYVYKIKEKKIIKPGDVSILKRDKSKSEITLMTCWPIGTTLNRMIVIGELVKE